MTTSPAAPESSAEVVIAYHERTKHYFHRYAASLGHLDWATQPDPFRRYTDAPLLRLPLPAANADPAYWQLYVPGQIPAQSLDAESLSRFFRYALSITAWKASGGASWALRANPSSGNLHPTEGYAVLPALSGISMQPGVYHYAPKEHGLEQRASLSTACWQPLADTLPPGSFLVGLSSIHWREAWKYGERAYRYCQHDVGHAIAAMRLAAAALGWQMRLLDAVDDDTIAAVLGLARAEDFDGAEREEPELLAVVTPTPLGGLPADLRENLAQLLADARWQGRANVLSPQHGIDWPVIDEVSRAAHRSAAGPITESFTAWPTATQLSDVSLNAGRLTAEQAILGRRSAVAMDGITAISRATFYQMLARLMPQHGNAAIPWDSIPWQPRVHLALFVHRVDGLTPGLYALVRDPGKLAVLQQAWHTIFQWQRPPACPDGLPLYLLHEADCRTAAATVSCGQDIAGDGAFSLGMITDYLDSLRTYGAAFYRNLFWEAGMVGQVLYLEAEEAGIRATGIGCYFDEPVHEILGITSRDWQSLYHFTVGGPVDDPRLQTLPAYPRHP